MAILIIKSILAGIFSLAVLGKLTGKTKSTWDKASYSPVVMYLTAVGEVLLTVGLFTQYSLYAAIGLLGIIGGAIFTLFRQHAKPGQYTLAIAAVALLATFILLNIKS